MTKIIAIYGKGGIGKSTTASNIAAACANIGYKVMIIGCDPKSDSSIILLNGKKIPTILDIIKNKKDISKEDIIFYGYKNIKCVEVGGPEPGVGCAGRGIIVAIEKIKSVYPNFKENDLIIYDVPGDVVCGGFVAPIKRGDIDEIYILTSGEYMSIYAANNICKSFSKINIPIGGIICNSRNNKFENEIIEEYSKSIGTQYIGFIEKNYIIQKCEREGIPVIEKYPDCYISNLYRNIGKKIMTSTNKNTITPLNDIELRELINKYNNI